MSIVGVRAAGTVHRPVRRVARVRATSRIGILLAAVPTIVVAVHSALVALGVHPGWTAFVAVAALSVPAAALLANHHDLDARRLARVHVGFLGLAVFLAGATELLVTLSGTAA